MSGYMQGQNLHVDAHLSGVALNYRPQGFIADRIAPIVPVDKQTNMIKTYNQADLFRRENTRRSPDSEAHKIGIDVGSTSYRCENFALKGPITIEDRSNADPAFIVDLEEGRVMRLQDALMLDWEVRVALQCTSTSNVGTSTAVASAWTDYGTGNSDPLNDLWTMLDNVEGATGYRPNRAVMGGIAWRHFSRHDDVISKVNQTGVVGGALPATREQAARLLQLEEVLVGNAWYNTAPEGQAMALTQVWGPNVLLYYAPDRPSQEVPSFMYGFRWTRPGLPNMQVERHPYDSKRKAEEIEIGYYQDEKIVATPLAALIVAVNSST